MTLDIIGLRKDYEKPHHLLVTSDGVTLFLRKWEPKTEEPRRSAVLILHGLTAYSGPYTMIAEPLSERGFTVYGLDLRGHGLSDGNRGDSPSEERFVKDLCETMAYVSEQHEKVVLIGHSLGILSSMFVMKHCLKYIGGSVLLSGGVSPRAGVAREISLAQKIKILLSSIVTPSKPVIKYEREGMVGLDDPLFNFRYTLRFMRMVRFENIEFPEKLDFPVFVGIGDSDELFSVDSCRELYERVPSDSKEFYVAEGAKHAEFPDGAWNPLIEWTDSKFG
ncbi:MAG: alpha/beta hydrolase [Candidatus Thorarchaeota archaeon]|jgi:alpha-beta hydrolase superfamily lysophospholipase